MTSPMNQPRKDSFNLYALSLQFTSVSTDSRGHPSLVSSETHCKQPPPLTMSHTRYRWEGEDMGDFSDDGLLCTFSNIPAALAAENVRSLKARQVVRSVGTGGTVCQSRWYGTSGRAVRSVRAGGTVCEGRRYGPFITVPRLAGPYPAAKLDRTPCWASSLCFHVGYSTVSLGQ
jgi:hypothetical protein